MLIFVKDVSVNICIQRLVVFQITQELVRGTSNLLVASMYWIVAFQIDVFDVSLFEEIPNRSSFWINNVDNQIGNEY